MPLCELRWFSQVLEKMVATTVILPENGRGPFPTFYLLHGLSDDHSTWHRRTRIEWYVRELPLIVVMPDGFRGYYTNHDDGRPFAKYIAEELVEQIERLFPTKRARSARCVGGLSMGGYGALRLAMGYPDRFVSATSHSGALMIGAKTYTSPAQRELRHVFGPRPAGSNHDLIELVRRCKAAGRGPKMRIDCGTDDFLIDDNRRFHTLLEEMDIPHEYEEFPGEHNWDYWDQHVQDAIWFHGKALKFWK